MNYFPFNVGDYAAHTGHLEPMEDLAYRRLLDQYYLREGPLPADIEATAKLVRMRSMKADVESVLKEFFTLTEAGWTHSRCEAEIEKARATHARLQSFSEAAAWRGFRDQVLSHDGFRCVYCGAAGVPLELDHIVPKSRGGTHSLENLTAACKPCNSSKGAKSLAEWCKV